MVATLVVKLYKIARSTIHDNGHAIFKVLFPNYSKNESAEDTRTAAMARTVRTCLFHILFVHAAAGGGTYAFAFNISEHADQNSSRDDRPLMST